ncbi:hypothetical protein RvY_11889-3 [Ramazzottius varieornatus]|uniref:Major facilitator superfamily (MFS) profile domain-containing protein n=1 Tax=Ramazzottius varieornatus TaxID=947166 RepID=A0A1D1VHM6_RAMVA|nr:hypothetical protein RvY_11889-3 [Ramazzottius varieornatus]
MGLREAAPVFKLSPQHRSTLCRRYHTINANTTSFISLAQFPARACRSAAFDIPFLGTRTSFCISSFVGAACYLSYAVLNIAEETAAFVSCATILRFVEGFVYATLSTSSNVITCLAFPEHATIAFGILECFVGIGYTVGPIIGGALYAAGGFSAACAFIGLSLLLTGFLGYFFLVQITGINLRPKPRETKRALTDRIFLGVAFVNFSGGMFWGVLGTSLEPYLASVRASPPSGCILDVQHFVSFL